MARKDDGEKVKVNLIDMKKLITIMKRFCGSKATDEEITKWFYCKDGLHYMATNLGSSVDILFTNNFAGTYNPLGESYFTKPVKDAEKVDAIPLMVEVKDGKKKKLMDTGRKLDFPDVNGIFDKFNLDEFAKVVLTKEEFDEMISLHETMESMEKVSGDSFTSVLRIKNNKMLFTVYDTPYKFLYEKEVDINGLCSIRSYFYNPSYFVNIFKSLKDLDVKNVTIYLKENKPILFMSRSTEYTYKFAMNRKLVRAK